MTGTCRACLYFRNNPAYLESVLQGLNTMSSAWASVMAEDGLCLHHDRLTGADSNCRDFEAAQSIVSDA
jgi:hypothetical protein